MLGGGLAGRCVCMFGSPLFLWLGVEVMLFTIIKCIWDLSPSSRGGKGVCTLALAFSAFSDHKTCKQQQVGRGFSLLPYCLGWAARLIGTSVLKSFQSRKTPQRGLFPKFLWHMCESLWLGHTVASLGEGITCLPLGKGGGGQLSA